jgi:demethylmenaquinone methyltransferase / 2-methoxy-6-polyprenyl-1,4-benzoquinol methylase
MTGHKPDAAAAPAPTPVTGETTRTGNPVPESRVATMFDSIAPVYDRMNTIMTAGFDGRWRRFALRATGLRSGGAALDVACGTGKLTAELAERVGPSGRVVGVDLSPAMIGTAKTALADLPQVELCVGNALALPFEDGTFDAATIAFGLRNLADFEAGFCEMARVVRSGGRVVCLELSLPKSNAAARLYVAVFRTTAPAMGMVFRHRSAYSYLPHSLEGFPRAEEIAATMTRAGLRDVKFRRLALGAVAIHAGTVA